MVIRITLMMRWKDLGNILWNFTEVFVQEVSPRSWLSSNHQGWVNPGGFPKLKRLRLWRSVITEDNSLMRAIRNNSLIREVRFLSRRIIPGTCVWSSAFICRLKCLRTPGVRRLLKWNSDRLRLRSWTLNKSRKLSLYFEETLNYFSSWNKFI